MIVTASAASDMEQKLQTTHCGSALTCLHEAFVALCHYFSIYLGNPSSVLSLRDQNLA